MAGKIPDIKWDDDDQGFDDVISKQKEQASATEEFAELLTGISQQRQVIRVGEKTKGIISQIGDGNDVLVDLGIGKMSGIIEKIELTDEAGQIKAKVGDEIEAFVISKRGDEVILSNRMSVGLKSIEDLERAAAAKIPVRGKVTKVVKGGLEVTILGKTAFCPVSQIDTRFVAEPGEFLGQELEFLVERVEEKGRNIVVARAPLLRMQAEEKMKQLVDGLKPDQVFDGVVRELRDFGVFVDIGGIDGMVHISELSHARVVKPGDVVSKGDKVRVKLLKAERDAQGRPKLSLSMKAVQEDPWDRIHQEIAGGESYQARVTKLMPFGAFVELKPGIEGLLHVSEMSWLKRVHHPQDVMKVGDVVTVTVKEIDTTTKRISLSMKSVESDPWFDVDAKLRALHTPGGLLAGKVERLKPFGAIVEFEPGLSGLLPISVIKKKFGDSYKQQCTPGKILEVKPVHVDKAERKISLTLPGLDEDEAFESDYREYVAEAERARAAAKADEAGAGAATSQASGRVGSFGALLGAKLQTGQKGK